MFVLAGVTYQIQNETRLQGCDIKHDHNGVNNDESRCEDIKMSQNGGNHAIRRRKLPLKSVLPTFFGDLPFLGRYISYMSVTW